MALALTAYFADGNKETFECADDEDATMKRDDLLEYGHQEKRGKEHIFYPAHSVIKIVIAKD